MTTDDWADSAQGKPLSRDTAVIGLLGAGDMGAGIGYSLLRDGWKLLAFDIRPGATDGLVSKGALAADSAADLAARADLTAVVVLDDDQVRSAVRSMLPTIKPGAIIMVNSTVLPSTVRGLREEAVAVGADLIDAGVAGGGEKSNLGTLTVMVGGGDGAVSRAWPAIESFSAHPFHLGGVGAGVAGKLVNNILSLAGYALILEAMQLGAAYGLTEEKITEFVTRGGGDSRMIRTWGRQDRLRRERAHLDKAARYNYFVKDVRDAAIAAGEQHVILPLVSAASQLIPSKLEERDAMLAALEETPDVPRCSVCNQELSRTYQEAGLHPECAAGYWG
jgi:3-hydroxyisobutyrate dehydrogenase-like beta-hydroxyacid dehydrogenase